MREIIERLVEATGPDREIDELLFQFQHGRKRQLSTFEQYDPSEKLPAYTESIDAALTLVPTFYSQPGFYGDRFYLLANGTQWTCAIQLAYGVGHWSEHWKDSISKSVSPAIAVCLTALKAHSEISKANIAVGDRPTVPASGDPS